MNVKCPKCQVEFASKDLEQTAKNGCFVCPVCGKKIPSSLAGSPPGNSQIPFVKIVIPIIVFAGLVSLYSFFYPKPGNESFPKPPAANISPTLNSSVNSNKQPSAPDNPAQQALPPVANPALAANISMAPPPLDKKQIVKKIAAEFHKTHTYTLEGDFVCLDMAIDVWNQLMTHGIDAKIMGGNVKENIMTWNYRQLLKESNHAWVLARLSPTEKVAVETTAGVVIEPGMKNSAAYFKGIEFNNPSEIKKFDSLRKKGKSVCRDYQMMVDEWNSNIAGKQRATAEIMAKKGRLEQRKSDCESAWNDLDEFKSRAIFY